MPLSYAKRCIERLAVEQNDSKEVQEVSDQEAWLYAHSEAYAAVIQGLAQAQRGELYSNPIDFSPLSDN